MAISRLVLLSIVAYVLAIVWVLVLHPLVSVSTGETKPRSLFVDEHSLPVQSHVIERTIKEFKVVDFDKKSPCFAFSNINAICEETDDTESFLSISVNPAHVSSPREQILIGLVLPTENVDIDSSNGQCSNHKRVYPNRSINLLWNIVYYFREAKWNTKQLRIVAAPSSKSLHSMLFNSSGGLGYSKVKNSYHEKLLRESFILDLSDLDQSLQWQEITLLSHDALGTLPNMDMISYLLHLHPYHNIQLPLCIFENELNVFADHLYQVLTPLEIAWRGTTFITSGSFQRRLDGYLHHICIRFSGYGDARKASLQNSLTGFLQYNVDSIALEFHRNKQSLSTRRHSGRKLINTGPLPLLVFIFDLIYGSNNLEEELHHSYHHYILMGEQTFVGMNEYALPGMLFILSFFLLAILFLDKSPISGSSFSLASLFRRNRISETQPLKLVGHKVSSSQLLVSLIIVVINHRVVPLLSDLIKYILPEGYEQFGSLGEMLAGVMLSSLILIVDSVINKSSEKKIDGFEITGILQLGSGLELLFSVVYPLVRLAIQDIAKCFVCSIVLYPVVIICNMLIWLVITSFKRNSNDKQFSMQILLSASLFFFFFLGYFGFLWVCNRLLIVSAEQSMMKHFLLSIVTKYFAAMSSNFLVVLILHLIF